MGLAHYMTLGAFPGWWRWTQCGFRGALISGDTAVGRYRPFTALNGSAMTSRPVSQCGEYCSAQQRARRVQITHAHAHAAALCIAPYACVRATHMHAQA